MKDVREFLALLTERGLGLINSDRKGTSYNVEGRGINQIDVAHALGYVKNHNAARLLGVKYGGRTSDIHDLDIAVWMAVIEKFPNWTQDKTYQRGKEFVRRMCQLALAEYMDEHRCPVCNGTSAAMKETMKHVFHDMVYCEPCKDSGRVYPSDGERADVMGIDPMLWNRHWRDRFDAIKAMLSGWEISAAGDMYRALKRA